MFVQYSLHGTCQLDSIKYLAH